ncbi:hypothetical protein V8F20_012803, partial [Naviculisporaceae sp. PSN 640]
KLYKAYINLFNKEYLLPEILFNPKYRYFIGAIGTINSTYIYIRILKRDKKR